MAPRIGQYTSGVLTSMLQDGKPVVKQLIHVRIRLTDDTKDAAHGFARFEGKRGCFLSLRWKASRLWTMRLLGPAVFSDLGGLAVSACSANAFLLVVGVVDGAFRPAHQT